MESTLFDDFMGGRVYMNPSNTDHKKAVDNTLARRGRTDPEYLVQVVAKTSYMPQIMQNDMIGAALNTPHVETFTEQLEIYGRLNDVAPHMLAEISSDANTVLGLAAEAVRTGSDPGAAMEYARDILAKAPEQKEARQQQYDNLVKDSSNADALQSLMDGDEELFDLSMYYTSDVSPSAEMALEFSMATEREFMKVGDIQTARGLAYNNSIRRFWGISGVGSRMKDGEMSSDARSQKYPPERTLNVSTKQANGALKAFADENGLDVNNLQVFYDPITARDGSTWSIIVVDPKTQMMTEYDKRWAPKDYLAHSINANNDTELKAAKIERERIDAESLETLDTQKQMQADPNMM